jgi:DNA-binding response OmpR family regulator
VTVLLLFPEPSSPALLKVLDLRELAWKAVSDHLEASELEPAGGWSGAVISLDESPERALSVARWVRGREEADTPILALISADRLGSLETHVDLFDDFCLTPFHPTELEARLSHMLLRAVESGDENVISYGPLSLNIETYQAVIEGRALDLTYMEYELLRYLAAEPGKVFSRESLLSEVWGYDYYGGARTVDVHIRRLRAKLGEEHANMISTVRSVGYRLGQARWDG